MQVNITQEMIEKFRGGQMVRGFLADSTIRAGLERVFALVSDCLACPDGCGECSKDRTCCECYEHQDRHPEARGQEAIQAIHDAARGGRVTEAYVRRTARHFGFEV